MVLLLTDRDEGKARKLSSAVLVLYVIIHIVGLGFTAYAMDIPNIEAKMNLIIIANFILGMGGVVSVFLIYLSFKKRGLQD